MCLFDEVGRSGTSAAAVDRYASVKSNAAVVIDRGDDGNNKDGHQQEQIVGNDVISEFFKKQTRQGGEDHAAAGVRDLEPFQRGHIVFFIGGRPILSLNIYQ